MNNYGTYTWFGYTTPFEDRLKVIKDAGFGTVCTFWAKEMEEIDSPRVSQPEIADKYGLFLEHSHLPYFNCDALWRDDLAAESMVEMYLEGVDRAKDAGLSTLVIHPCEVFAPDMHRYPMMLENMRRIADACYDSGVRLAIENLGENVAIRRVINDLSENPYVGLCFDTGHNNVVDGKNFELLREFSDRIFATHIHDNNGKQDQHYLPYSEGCNVDWKEFMAVMQETSFGGSLMLEASYPINYDDYDGEDDLSIANPDYPMALWLSDAAEACLRIYNEK